MQLQNECYPCKCGPLPSLFPRLAPSRQTATSVAGLARKTVTNSPVVVRAGGRLQLIHPQTTEPLQTGCTTDGDKQRKQQMSSHFVSRPAKLLRTAEKGSPIAQARTSNDVTLSVTRESQ
jgi:hypothetical protein